MTVRAKHEQIAAVRRRPCVLRALVAAGLLIVVPGHAQTATAEVTAGYPPPPGTPPVPRTPPPGGHIGLALPIVSVARDTTVIGDDFIDLGLAPGITIPFNPCWSFDFEFVVYDHLKTRRGAPTLVVDPGVIYDWGPLATGLRAAMAMGGGNVNNFGLIPIINTGFPIFERLKWFIELDLPVFFTDAHRNRVTFTPQLQTGVAF